MTTTCEATIVAPLLEEATLWPVTSDNQNPGNSVSYEWKAVAYASNSTITCSTGVAKDKNRRTLRFRVRTPIFVDGIEQPSPLEGQVEISLPTDTSVLAADLSRLLTMLQAPLGPCAFNVFRFGRFPLEQIPVNWIEAGYYDTYL
jgi:hypothetical protein